MPSASSRDNVCDQEIYDFAAPEDDDLPEVPYCGASNWEPMRFFRRAGDSVDGYEHILGRTFGHLN